MFNECHFVLFVRTASAKTRCLSRKNGAGGSLEMGLNHPQIGDISGGQADGVGVVLSGAPGMSARRPCICLSGVLGGLRMIYD